ncbi:hypothetical protein [Chamaesiphon sp.]|uniref:hypothetical protein n=1 Tax=Chamaesiphon sp. TaxID=2814140 RepID=UPI003593AA02
MTETNPEQNMNAATGNRLPRVHIWNGKIGGIGKTTGARIQCEAYHQLGKKFTLIDADDVNYNVARLYDKEIVAQWESRLKPASGKMSRKTFLDNLEQEGETNEGAAGLLSQQIIFSDDPKLRYLGKRFLEIIDTYQQDVIVSLPANDSFEFLLDSNRIDRLLSKDDRTFDMINWWCIPGCEDSQKMFAKFIEKYPHIKHVAVFNQGITSVIPNWEVFRLSKELSVMLKEKRFSRTAISELEAMPPIIDEIGNGVPYREIIAGTKVDKFSRGDLEDWLNHNIEALKETGYVD